MPSINSKFPQLDTTIFTAMSHLAEQEEAINLSQGFPDFQPNDELTSKVTEFMQKGKNQYAPMAGVMNLREAIAEKIELQYRAKYHPEDEVTITAGATQAIFTAIAAVIKEEDEVIIFSPAYDCYKPTVELFGGKPITIPLKTPNYSIDWGEVKKLMNRKTKMIIINTPHNPSGTILKKEDLLELEKLVRNTDVLILSDEVYEHIIFDEQDHQSVCKFPSLTERSFAIFSFGKTYHNTGWKIGYCVAPKNLMHEFRKIHQYNVFSCNTPVQYALSKIIKKKSLYQKLPKFYQKKRDLFLEGIKGSRFKAIPSQGTYFQLLDYSEISKKTDLDYAIFLTKKHKVASIPLSPFYSINPNEKVLRFCFAKNNETIAKATEILCKI